MALKHTISSVSVQTSQEVATGLVSGWIHNSPCSLQHLVQCRKKIKRGMCIGISPSDSRDLINGGQGRSFYEYPTPVHISTALKRPPSAIIADVQHELLPPLDTKYAAALSWIETTAVRTERQQWLHKCLRQLCDIRKTHTEGRHLYVLKWAEMTTALFTEGNFHNHFDLQLNDLTPDRLIRIAGLDSSSTTGIPMTDNLPVYFDEGVNGTNKYTFEVYKSDEGGYVVYVRRWNAKLNKIQEETRFSSPDKAGLKTFKYPNSRQAKAFLTSDFWSEKS